MHLHWLRRRRKLSWSVVVIGVCEGLWDLRVFVEGSNDVVRNGLASWNL